MLLVNNPMKTRLLTLLLSLVMLFGCAQQPPKPSKQKPILISHVNIIDVANNTIIENQFVLLKQGKIDTISPTQPKIELDSTIIDGENKFLMAGLIDMHVHIFQNADLYQLLTHGVTTARVMIGSPTILKQRDNINKGLLIGPQLVVSSPIINQQSTYANAFYHRFIDSAEQGVELVNQYSKQGYDLIKVYDGLRPEIFSAIALGAKENQLPIAGHPSFYLTIDDFLAADPQTIEHIEMLYQATLDFAQEASLLVDLAKKLAKYNVPVTTTLIVYDNLAKLATQKHQFIDSLPTNYIHPVLIKLAQKSVDFITRVDEPQLWRQKADYLGHMAKILNDNKVPLVLGSDSGSGYTIHGKSTIDEMELLYHYGIAANDILKAATITPAIALKKEQQIGIVAIGYNADLILLDGDPRSNLSVLRKPVAVIKAGRLYDQLALAKLDNKAQQHMGWFDTILHLLQFI
jgi:imidazolonepropionase-like amidohydrolase